MFKKHLHQLLDLWLSCLIFILGIHILSFQPIENIIQYHSLLDHNITSNRLGGFSLFVGLMSIIKIMLSVPIHPIISAFLQCCNLLVCLLVFFSVIDNDIIPMGAIYYGMVSLLSIIIIFNKPT